MLKFNKKIIIACVILGLLIPAYFHLKFHFTGEEQPHHSLIIGCFYSFIIAFLIFTVNIKTYNWLNPRFPWDKKRIQRIIVEFLLTNLNASIIVTIFVFVFSFSFKYFWNKELHIILFNNIIVSIIINTFCVSIIEASYFFKQWKKSLIQSEQLKKENIRSQFEALKNQIDPHFLFNNMNTIYSLIDSHPDKAKEFIAKFSKTFRHVLDVKENVVVLLKNELEFLDSYIFLQKIRHEGNLNISTNIKVQKLNYYLPPLSLQILVENAVKHNIISKQKPLKIEIFDSNNSLIVKNNLQPKNSINESTKIGLNNLTERYKHISDKVPEFYIKDNEYIAEIPLLLEE